MPLPYMPFPAVPASCLQERGHVKHRRNPFDTVCRTREIQSCWVPGSLLNAYTIKIIQMVGGITGDGEGAFANRVPEGLSGGRFDYF
jgi:hypothetical protein